MLMQLTQSLTVHEAARHLDVSEPSLRMAIWREQLRAKRHLGRVRLLPEDLAEYVRHRSQA